MENPDRILAFALDMGTKILACGGETRRAEDTLTRICKAYGASSVDTAAVNSLFTATIRIGGNYYTQTRRIEFGRNNFYRLEELNALSRKVCAEPIPLDSATAKMDNIGKSYPYGKLFVYIGAIIATSSSSVFFGGSILDGLAAAVIGLMVAFFDLHKIRNLNPLVNTLLLSLGSGLAATLLLKMGIGQNTDKVFIGIIMMLIPGLATVNAIRDLLGGDLMTGLFRLLQALITATAIAYGFALAVRFGGEASQGLPAYDPWITPIFSSLTLTTGFALLFRAKRKRLPVILPGSLITIVIYLLLRNATHNEFISTMAATTFMTMYAEVAARLCKAPVTVLLILGIIALVPGGSLYYTMTALVRGDYAAFQSYGSATVEAVLGISIGVIIVSVVTIIFFQVLRYIQKKSHSRKVG